MAIRTNSTDVQGVLGDDYDGSTSLTPFITAASSIVDRLSAMDSSGILTSSQLEIIECWLSAHAYCMMDKQLLSRTTGRSSGVITGRFDRYLDMTTYGQMAVTLDFTGKLATIGKTRAGMNWLGKPPSEQIDYQDRD